MHEGRLSIGFLVFLEYICVFNFSSGQYREICFENPLKSQWISHFKSLPQSFSGHRKHRAMLPLGVGVGFLAAVSNVPFAYAFTATCLRVSRTSLTTPLKRFYQHWLTYYRTVLRWVAWGAEHELSGERTGAGVRPEWKSAAGSVHTPE